MQVIIQPTTEHACKLTALIAARQIRAKPDAVLGLATGRTMEAVYTQLVRMHKEEGLDFAGCRSFNLTEFIGLPPTEPQSYRYYMNYHLFDRVNIDKKNTHLPDGMAEHPKVAAAEYERAIQAAGGVDLQLLSIGPEGHIGFNEHLASFASRTRPVLLPGNFVEQATSHFAGQAANVPKRAITMGIGTLLDARRILLLITGGSKAEIAAATIEGPISGMTSASALHFHPLVVVVLDEAAGAKLQEKNHYRWTWDHDPEWAEFRAALARR